MHHLLAIWRAIQFLLMLFEIWLREQLREEGRQEVRDQQDKANEAAAQTAAEIDRSVAADDLDALRDRMRNYQRPSDAL